MPHGARAVRGSLVAVALALAACGGGGQEPVSTPPSTTPPTTAPTTSTAAAADPDPSTSEPATTMSTLPPLQGLAYETVASGMPFPTYLTARPGDDLAYLLTKDGRVWAMGGGEPVPVLDIRDRVGSEASERGLLGMALHPDDPERVFLHYSAAEDGDTVVAAYRFGPDGAIDPGSAAVLLRLDQPAANHNGGMLQFGPDGHLYLGLGDGGGAGDRFGNGQNTETLLGGIVRIDVDTGANSLWAYGLRNPWRFWIDEETGVIYIADVGQGSFEEVNAVPFEPEFYNFGWPTTEGLHCFSPSQGCSTEGLTLPVVEVPHSDAGTCSITGGVVYRGEGVPELAGAYLYSDFCGGYLRSFRWDGAQVSDLRDWTDQVGVPGSVTSFGVDGSGEVYVLTTDAVLRVTAVR